MSKIIRKTGVAVSHRIQLDGPHGQTLYRDRLARDELLVRSRGLLASPPRLSDDESQLRGVAGLLNQLHGDMVLTHPVTHQKILITRQVGPRVAFDLASGVYAAELLEAVEEYVTAGSRVACIGAGLGVVAAAAGLQSGEVVLAVEPLADLHPLIVRNAELNKVDVVVRTGCVLAGQNRGEADFHVRDEPTASSLFNGAAGGPSQKTVRVPVLAIDELIAEHKASTLVIDVHGAELGLFDGARLDGVRRVIVRMAPQVSGEQGVARTVGALSQLGLHLVDLKGRTFIFKA